MAENLRIAECQDFGLATVMLRKNANAAAVSAALQLDAPTGPSCVASNGIALIGTGPGTWFAFTEKAAPFWANELAMRLPGVSISDQSGGYVIFKMTGPAARALLQRGAFIDLDPSVFQVGSVATTVIAHIGVVIWQIDDATTFHVALFRSFAESFREWIRAAATASNI